MRPSWLIALRKLEARAAFRAILSLSTADMLSSMSGSDAAMVDVGLLLAMALSGFSLRQDRISDFDVLTNMIGGKVGRYLIKRPRCV